MTLHDKRLEFEKNKKIYESKKVTFIGVDGFDVYNCSIPFSWKGENYIYGRVEKHDEWARSWVKLFKKTGEDEYTLVPDSMVYQLEDPYIAKINNILVMGGTHVEKVNGQVSTYRGYFYKGDDLEDLYYFTTGPDYMKDIRLVQFPSGKIGVFSRPRSEEILKQFGCESMIGYTEINDLSELTPDLVQNARIIPNIFSEGEWGGCNQAYILESGKIGIIGHHCYHGENDTQVYMNVAFIFDPAEHKIIENRILATRPCYPEGIAKRPNLVDCAFPAGIVMREDGKADLYSGIGDSEVGRVTIDYPFEGYGKIISK